MLQTALGGLGHAHLELDAGLVDRPFQRMQARVEGAAQGALPAILISHVAQRLASYTRQSDDRRSFGVNQENR